MSNGAVSHLDIGGVFDSTGEIYKHSFATVWIVALILMVPTAIIGALLGDGGIEGLIAGLIQLAASAWLAGAVVKVVEDVEADGRQDKSFGELLGAVWPRLIPLIILQFLFGLMVGIGLILLIVPGVILALMFIVALPAMVVEGHGVFDAFSRSSELTRGNRMRILAVGLLILVIYIAVFAVVAILAAISVVLGILGLIIAGVLLYPYVSIISAVLFFRLRELGQAPEAGLDQPAPLS